MKQTSTGKSYTLGMKEQIGNGVTGTVKWQIISFLELTAEEIDEIIETQYPYAGYGRSNYTRSNCFQGQFTINVTSHASCD